jgi:hypothetical protein
MIQLVAPKECAGAIWSLEGAILRPTQLHESCWELPPWKNLNAGILPASGGDEGGDQGPLRLSPGELIT